jgi:hypothetical protein
LSAASIAVPEAFWYIFWAIATTGDRRKEAVLDWARILACVTGTVDQELLARNEYLATENRILKDQLKGRLLLSDAERATLGEIGRRLGRKVLAEAATVARPDTTLAWYRKLVARKFSGSQARQGSGPTAAQARGGATDHWHGEREPGTGATTGSWAPWPISGMCFPIRRLAMFCDGTACHPRRSASARPVVGLHSNPLGAAGGHRFLHHTGAHAARSGDLLRAVFHPS